MEANKVLDRLADLLAKATSEPWVVQVAECDWGFWRVVHGHAEVFDDGSACGEYSPACDEADRDAIVAIRNAAPALIRLARIAVNADHVGFRWDEVDDAIKALGEVRP